MKVDSSVSNSINVKNINDQGERLVRLKSSSETDLETKKIADEVHTDAKPEEVTNEDMIDNAVKQANKTLEIYDKYIERYVHPTTNTIMYVLRDRETNEIIREFPPKKIQDMLAKMWELAGLIVDERR